MAFLQTGASPEMNQPDLQLHFFHVVLSHVPQYIASSGTDWSRVHDPNQPICGITMAPTLLHPRSIGSVTLRSADPLAPPVIDANYLADPHDLRVLVEGMKIDRKLAAQPIYKGHLGEELVDRTIPHDPSSDAYLEEYVKRYAVTVYHPVGTCKMGPTSDPLAVVDRTLGARVA